MNERGMIYKRNAKFSRECQKVSGSIWTLKVAFLYKQVCRSSDVYLYKYYQSLKVQDYLQSWIDFS